MNIWELPKEHYNWESPITKIYGDIHNEIIRQDEENYICTIEQAIGYKVDKEELIKALQYDRNQYDKGYNDGVKETFVEELEKIKREIGRIETEEGGDFLERPAIDIIYEAQKIVEKYISELSEEAEEKSNKDNKQGVLKQIAEKQKTLLDSTKVWSNYIDKNGNIY